MINFQFSIFYLIKISTFISIFFYFNLSKKLNKKVNNYLNLVKITIKKLLVFFLNYIIKLN